MIKIQVLGSGCAKCDKVVEKLEDYVKDHNVQASVVKESDPKALMQYKVMKTPAIIIDEKLIHAGSIPTMSEIETWLT